MISSLEISFRNQDDVFCVYFTVFHAMIVMQVLRIVKSCAMRPEYNKIMGFEEISHTADWSARVWAQDLPSLFAESARAMNSLAGTVTAKGPRVKRIV